VLRAGDVLVAVDGAPAADLASLRSALRSGAPGRVVQVGVVRDGAPQRLAVTTGTGPDGEAVLGVLVDPRFDFPVDVDIQVDRIGGPSAGMVFALGVYDLLTPGSLTGGRRVAGTGTIDATGEVGAIGGIASKMVGARQAGATLFLAPAANCAEVVGHVPAGLRVVRVGTLHEARLAVQAVAAGRGSGLPGCG
jgi:PDZ domain-containing protein